MGTEDEDVSTGIDAAGEEAFKNLTQEQKVEDIGDDEFDYDDHELHYTRKEGEKVPSNSVDEETKNNNSANELNQPEIINRSDSENFTIPTVNAEEGSEEPMNKNVACGDNQDNDIRTTSSEQLSQEYMQAKDEWNNVQEIPISTEPSTKSNSSCDCITFTEALEHFETLNFVDYNNKIRPYIRHTGVSSLWHIISGPPKLSKNLTQERDLIFVLAAVTFDNSNETHIRILQTVYRKLTKTKIDCPRFGPHWENVGFQGNDPSTDLRGCGMLGLLTTLYFITSKDTAQLAATVYHLSQDEIQNFPFSVMSINVTRIALQILREGKLNKSCNARMKEKSGKYRNDFDLAVFEVFLELYVAIFHKIYYIWKTQGKTMTESGFVVKSVEDYAKKKPLDLMKNFVKLTSKDTHSKETVKIQSFVGVEDLEG